MSLLLDSILPFLGDGPFPCLGCVCNDDHILEVAKRLTQWRNAALRFGFDRATVEDLINNDWDEEGTRQQMLLRWKQEKGSEATYGALAEVLLKLRQRSLAERAVTFSKSKQLHLQI